MRNFIPPHDRPESVVFGLGLFVHAAIALWFLLVLTSCGPSPAPRTPGDEAFKGWELENSCVIDSAVKTSALAAHEKMSGTEIPRAILAMKFPGNKGHAMACFTWENERYAWDADFGSRRTAAPWNSPLGVARTMYPEAIAARWIGGKAPGEADTK